jgi:hypothetical protein
VLVSLACRTQPARRAPTEPVASHCARPHIFQKCRILDDLSLRPKRRWLDAYLEVAPRCVGLEAIRFTHALLRARSGKRVRPLLLPRCQHRRHTPGHRLPDLTLSDGRIVFVELVLKELLRLLHGCEADLGLGQARLGARELLALLLEQLGGLLHDRLERFNRQLGGGLEVEDGVNPDADGHARDRDLRDSIRREQVVGDVRFLNETANASENQPNKGAGQSTSQDKSTRLRTSCLRISGVMSLVLKPVNLCKRIARRVRRGED